MKKFFTLILLSGFPFLAFSQYTTPGNGTTYTFSDLVDISQGTVTLEGANEYHVHDDLTISDTDQLSILEDITVKIAATKRIFVEGTLISDPPQQAIFTAINTEENFRGFRFDTSEGSIFRNTVIEYGGGIQLLDTDMLIEDCVIRYNDRSNTSAALNLSSSNPIIRNCQFLENAGSAIGSGANVISVPQILNNEFINNGTDNTNRPQINMGPTDGDTLKIIGNTIEGEYTMAGGIAVSNLLSVGTSIALIEDNLVFDNRYGYSATGNNIMSVIRNNQFLDNNIQGDPMLGGSGLNFLGTEPSNTALVYNNIIRGNLWGITIQNNAQPNIGDESNSMTGFNVIENNMNNDQIFGLYNNTPQAIMAQNNYWGTSDEQTVSEYIVGQHQNPELGEVTYMPFWIPENMILDFSFTAELNDELTQTITGVINEEEQTIWLTVPEDTDVTNLIPSIEASPFATVNPSEGQPVDFTSPVTYTVSSFIQEERIYEVYVVESETPVYNLTFNVSDTDGQAIEDAVITLNGETSPEGHYIFTDLTPGTYDYIVEAPAYSPVSGSVEIVDADVVVDITLELMTFTLTFEVNDASGNPIDDAIITLNGEAQPEGEYIFTDMTPGSYEYIVEKQGYFDAEGTVVITDQDVIVDVVLNNDTWVDNPEELVDLSFYPNPAADFVEINFNDLGQDNDLRLYSITGTLVNKYSNISPSDRIDISSLPGGIYLLQFSQGDNIFTRKLTISR